jgi:hypothetical protein
MMSLPGAIDKFFRHLGTMKLTPGMRFTAQDVPVESLTNYHIIGDTKGKDTCYIMAHGGNKRTEYFLDCMDFRVPSNTTVEFYHDHGDALMYHMSGLGVGTMPKTKVSDGQKLYVTGDRVQNYMLNKYFGHGGYQKYEDLQSLAKDGNHVFVSPRSRWHHGGVTLKNLIATVQGKYPAIRHFNCLFCRAVEGTTHQWNATVGEMELVKN